MSRIIITLFYLLLSNLAFGKTTVVYLNGINVSDSKPSAIRLKEVIQSRWANNDLLTGNITVSYWNNPTNGLLIDAYELLLQAKYSYEATKCAGILKPRDDFDKYNLCLGNFYKQEIEKGAGLSEDSVRIFSVVSGFANALQNRVAQGDNVIVVAHSQGNYFSEATNAYLKIVDPEILKKVQFVGVASVASSSPDNRYVSIAEDGALAAHEAEKVLSTIAPIASLPRNQTLCKSPIGSCIASIFKDGANVVGHAFSEVYLSDAFYDNDFSPSQIISNFIKASFDELNPPKPTTPTITDMTPKVATIGVSQTFTVTGTNLPTNDHLDIVANGCANIVFGTTTASSHTFTCTPTGGNLSITLSSPPPYTAYSKTFSIEVCGTNGGSQTSTPNSATTTPVTDERPATGTITNATETGGLLGGISNPIGIGTPIIAPITDPVDPDVGAVICLPSGRP